MNNFIQRFLLLLTSVLYFSSCHSKKSTKIEQKITINIESDYNTLDPRKARSLNDYNLIKCFNEGLFRHVGTSITKAIADSYYISNDRTLYEIKLKKTYWSNGDPLTAHDFIYAWKSLLHKDFNSPYAYYLFYIKNGQEIKSGTLPPSALRAFATDDYTIEIELDKPTPFFLQLLALPIFLPIHRKIDTKFPNWHYSYSKYVCNGPFYPKTIKRNELFYPRARFPKSLKKTEYIQANKNPFYWDKDNVHLTTINMILVDENIAYNFFKQKKLHYIGAPFSDLSDSILGQLNTNHYSKTSPMLATSWIRVNVNSSPLNDIHLRHALARTIDRKNISNLFFEGTLEIAAGVIPTNIQTIYPVKLKNKNSNQAIDKLEPINKLFKVRPLTLSFIQSQKARSIALILQDNWQKELGITIELEGLEKKVFFQRLQTGNYDLAYSRKIADFKDPIDFLEVFKTKDSGLNNTGWENKKYQEAIEQSYFASSSKERNKICARAEEILLEEMPIIPMHHLNMMYLADPQLKGLIFSEVGILDFKSAYLSELP